jgi:cell division protein FtsI/penicillin-binding protein 2
MKHRTAPIIFFLIAFAGILIALALMPDPGSEKPPATRLDLSDAPKKDRPPATWTSELDLHRFTEKDGALWQTTPSGVMVQATLDPQLQAFLTQEFQKYELPYAAAVVLHLPDGEVRALAGHSQAEPRLTMGELALKPWAPAASLFKTVSAIALMITPGFDPQRETCYAGGQGGITEKHLEEPPETEAVCENLETALANSTNAVLGRLARAHLDVRRLQDVAQACGFNQDLPFEFAVEKSRFKLADTDPMALPRAAAGFGHATISAWHAAWLAALVAQNGAIPPVHVLRLAIDRSRNPVELPRPAAALFSSLPAETVARLRLMLARTVTQGTAKEGFYKGEESLVPVTVGGKTGTLGRTEPQVLLYTWFMGYAPVEAPRWAFAILVVSPEKWRTKASYMAARLVNRLVESETGPPARRPTVPAPPMQEGPTPPTGAGQE